MSYFPPCSFTLNGEQLEIVNSFQYLGFTFCPQLSFTKHVQALVTKANSRCGILRSRLPINNLSIELVLSTFACYIIPIFRYGLPLWLNATSNSAKQSVNAVLTKFLKSYLCIPFHANNAITHFVTNTQPLLRTLEFMALECTSSFVFPEELHGHSVSVSVSVYFANFRKLNYFYEWKFIAILTKCTAKCYHSSLYWRTEVLGENSVNGRCILPTLKCI